MIIRTGNLFSDMNADPVIPASAPYTLTSWAYTDDTAGAVVASTFPVVYVADGYQVTVSSSGVYTIDDQTLAAGQGVLENSKVLLRAEFDFVTSAGDQSPKFLWLHRICGAAPTPVPAVLSNATKEVQGANGAANVGVETDTGAGIIYWRIRLATDPVADCPTIQAGGGRASGRFPRQILA